MTRLVRVAGQFTLELDRPAPGDLVLTQRPPGPALSDFVYRVSEVGGASQLVSRSASHDRGELPVVVAPRTSGADPHTRLPQSRPRSFAGSGRVRPRATAEGMTSTAFLLSPAHAHRLVRMFRPSRSPQFVLECDPGELRTAGE